MTVLLVTPLQKEMDAFLKSCAARGHKTTQTSIGRLPVAQVDSLHLIVALGGNGKIKFAVQTQHLLDSGNNWHAVICAGTCGALTSDVSVGDVVVGPETIEHDYYNRFNERPTPSFAGDPDMLAALLGILTDDYSFNLHFGPIASGDEDIVDVNYSATRMRWSSPGKGPAERAPLRLTSYPILRSAPLPTGLIQMHR